MSMPRLRLCLSGGGTSGILAHAAAVTKLMQLGYNITEFGGISAGAVVAAAAAAGKDPLSLAVKLLCADTPLETLSPGVHPYPQLYSGDGVLGALRRHLPGTMGEVPTRLSIITANVGLRRQEIWRSYKHPDAELAMRVYASLAVPGVFPPALIGRWLYVDGGVTSNVGARDLYGDTPEGDEVLVLRIRHTPDNMTNPSGMIDFFTAVLDTMLAHQANEDIQGFRSVDLPVTGSLVDFQLSDSRARGIITQAQNAVQVWHWRKTGKMSPEPPVY